MLQLNSSGCNCTNNNCEQTTSAFQQLTQSMEQCSAGFNYPIHDVAKKIHRDANNLRTIIAQLHDQNPHGNNASGETTVKVESEWCHY